MKVYYYLMMLCLQIKMIYKKKNIITIIEWKNGEKNRQTEKFNQKDLFQTPTNW